MSGSFHGLQHARLPWPSASLRVCSNSRPLSWWCLPTISSSITPSPPALYFPSIRGLFNESTLHIRWSTYWSFSFSISPSNEYSGLISFRIDWFDLLDVQGTSGVFSNITVQKHQFFGTWLSLWTNSHTHTRLLEKTIALTVQTFVSKMMSQLFNMLSRLVITFLPRSKCLSITWLQSPSALILQ